MSVLLNVKIFTNIDTSQNKLDLISQISEMISTDFTFKIKHKEALH